MEIWKIYHLMLALCSLSLANAESNDTGTGSKQIKMNPMVVFPRDDHINNKNYSSFDAVFENLNTVKTNLKDSFVIGMEQNYTEILGTSFDAKLFEILSSSSQHKNLVFSPISLETLLAFVFVMSAGKLNEELRLLLQLPNDQAYVAKHYEDTMQRLANKAPPTSLIMANKLYYDYHYGLIEPSVRYLAKNSFASEIEEMDFAASKKSANNINAWISERTHHLIQNIITPNSIMADTKALLVNSIYFKSEWLIKFGIDDTEVQPFYVTRSHHIPVDMMYNEDVFRYGDFTKDLQASAVELPYNASNVTMLLILPNDVEGLAELERKLRVYNLQALTDKLKRETVTVKLPKFKVEYEIDMIATLHKMGLNALFNNEGVITLFKNQQRPLKVDQFKHKAFINVNEAGTEAAAVTVAKYIPLSIPVNMKYFTADHPFVFVIRDGDTILFMGHVTQF